MKNLSENYCLDKKSLKLKSQIFARESDLVKTFGFACYR